MSEKKIIKNDDKKKIIKKIQKGINASENFYKYNEIKNTSGEYDDDIAKILLKTKNSCYVKKDDLKPEDVDARVKQYLDGTHENHIKAVKNGLYENTSKNNSESDQREKYIAKRLFELSYNNKEEETEAIKIIDYEIPVNSVQWSKQGKIDLIGRDDDNLYLFELKSDNSEESLLRAILEIKTYYERIINNDTAHERFKKVYSNHKLVPAILIFDETHAFKDAENMNMKKNNLYKLCKKYKIRIFKIKQKLDSNLEDIRKANIQFEEYNYVESNP